ncbi:prolyl-tRNA editing protein [Azorhizobium oxalatiphilum]|uniref:Prolyl-tRNA editing protein n=1 Tax=Azorhizobium oxalatiphilum TaxID=980631 RepID=A0A917CAI3_9HYPH|nr:prolyl-tRNA synthetase associated domain-containing protein [Azorhizobium oxalatiphilum]GGF81917.1 prolyl-tRNA editing protein [Azorhizobium oxalatiphilum]
MPLSPDDVLRFLDAHGIAARTHTHPPLRTVAESQALRGNIPGAHTKNLFLRDDKKTYFLVSILVPPGDDRPADLKALRHRIGARGRLSFGTPEALYEHLGVRPGSVSLLALMNDPEHRVSVVIDDALMASDIINCHPLTNDKTTGLSAAGLTAFLAATGHQPLTVDLQPETME